MENYEIHFNSLVSIIKIEPEEFQTNGEDTTSKSDEFLKRKAKM